MKKTTRAGLAIILIGLAIILPELQLLGIDFSSINSYLMLIPQLGIMTIALGWVMADD
jgi:hypothetical protein